MVEHTMTSPEIDQARTFAQSYRSRTGISDEVILPLIPVTGSDGMSRIYGLIYPIPAGQPAVMLAISGTGEVTLSGHYIIPPPNAGVGHPYGILTRGAEVGISFSRGAVAWYAA